MPWFRARVLWLLHRVHREKQEQKVQRGGPDRSLGNRVQRMLTELV